MGAPSHRKLYLLFFIIGKLLGFSSSCQVPNLIPERIDYDGLHHAKAIARDKYGFIWFGTDHGLYRYDGSHLKSYTHANNDSSSLSNNTINALYTDHTGLIWIASFGLNCFNPETGKFKKYFHNKSDPNSLSNDFVQTVIEDEYGHIWIGAIDGLNELDPATGKFTMFRHNQNDSASLSPGTVRVIFIDHLKRLWVCTDYGLNLYNRDKKTFTHFFASAPATSLKSWLIVKVCEEKSGVFWLGTWGEGLIRFDPNNNTYGQYWERPDKKHRGDHNVIFDIEPCETDSNYLYVASSENEFCLFDKRTSNFIKGEVPLNKIKAIESFHDLFNDRQGNLWIGSPGGTYKLDIRKRLFNELDISGYIDNDCLGCPVSIYEDEMDVSGNTLWLGTWTCGLVKFDLKEKTVKVLKKGLKRTDRENYYAVSDVARDGKNILWIGTSAGIFQEDGRGNIIKKFSWNKNDNHSLSHDVVNCIFKDKNNRLWIGTENGLNLYDPEGNRFDRYYPSQYVNEKEFNQDRILKIVALSTGQYAVMIDQKNIYIFDPGKKVFSPFFTSLKNPVEHAGLFYDILPDSKGNFWCAGTFGVLKFENISTNISMKWYTTAQGLSSDNATGVTEDGCGNIWITTANGLNMFTEQTSSFKSFYAKDGLYDNNMEGVLAKSSSGVLFTSYTITDTRGIVNYFNPCKWNFDTTPPPVVLTGVKLFNRDIDMVKSISALKEIELSYKDRMITFQFAALSYHHPERNQYAYRLEGFDKDWVFAGNNTSATYTNLDGGEYTFHVKAANDIGTWNETGVSLAVYIRPPFYETWWFYSLCLLGVSTIVYLIYRMRINQIKKLYEIRSGIARDLHDDIGSRLSSISIISQLADKKTDMDITTSKFYEQVRSGTKEAMELMSDIVWSVNPHKDKLDDMMIRMREYAAETLEAKFIDFRIHIASSLQGITLPMKIRKDFYLIYKEAINNLAKYSGCTAVNISLSREDDILILHIEDNGKGFDPGKVRSGNGLNNMRTRAHAIKGRLVLHSTESQGTSVRLEVPVA
jgi:ligand-binding sensor domain-containing protein